MRNESERDQIWKKKAVELDLKKLIPSPVNSEWSRKSCNTIVYGAKVQPNWEPSWEKFHLDRQHGRSPNGYKSILKEMAQKMFHKSNTETNTAQNFESWYTSCVDHSNHTDDEHPTPHDQEGAVATHQWTGKHGSESRAVQISRSAL